MSGKHIYGATVYSLKAFLISVVFGLPGVFKMTLTGPYETTNNTIFN